MKLLRRSSLKVLMVVIFSGIVALGIMSACINKVWTLDSVRRENGGAVYVSPKGEDYYVCLHSYDMYFEVDKKIGKCRATSGKTAKVYSIKGVDTDRFVAIENTKGYLWWESGPEYLILARFGEEEGNTYFESGEWSYTRTIDYTTTPVSAVAFVPYATHYDKYLEENGLFGEDAKNAMDGVLDSEPDSFTRHEMAGTLLLQLEGYEWFIYGIPVYGSTDEGYELCFGIPECFVLPDSTVDALGIGK